MQKPPLPQDPWALIPGADRVVATVSIVQATELSGDPNAIDAFARVWIGKRKMKKLTQVYQNSDCPAWNETFEFAPIPSHDPDYRWLLVEVFDHAAGPKPKDLGYFRFDLRSLKLNQSIKGWFKLKDAPSGKVLAEVSIARCMDKDSTMLICDSIDKRCKETGEKYCDPDFPAALSSIYTPIKGKEAAHLGRPLDKWMRPPEFIDHPKMFCDGVEAGDVIQGILGDCWFLGAASIIAARDDLLYPLVVKEVPEHGYYVFKFFKDGAWKYVIIDDRVPVSKRRQFLFAHCADRQEIWVPLMEKAYAKVHGCYQHLEGGSIAQGMTDLTGESAETFKWDAAKFPDMWARCKSGEFFEELKTFVLEEEYLVGCSLNLDDGSEKDMGMGIMSGHAYALLDLRVITDDAGKQIKLLKVRNPWGAHEWTGAWSDDSPLWTPRLMKELNHTSEDDGCFWIDWDNFILQYNNVMLCRLLQDEVGHKWSRHEEFSAWVGSAAAGSSSNRVTWHLSPQYRLTVERETELFISLAQYDRRLSGNYFRYPTGIGYDLRLDPDVDDELPVMLNHDKGLILSLDYFKGREVAKCIKVKPGTYRLIPSVFEPGTEARYYMAIFSYWPVKVDKLSHNVVEMAGEWSPGCSGGSNFTDGWTQNPKFELIPEHKRPQLKVIITLRQTSGNVAQPYPIDLYVVRRASDPTKLTKEQIVVQNNQPVASKLLVAYATLDAKDGPFLIVPVTSDPNQHASFVLRVYSPFSDVYNVEPVK